MDKMEYPQSVYSLAGQTNALSQPASPIDHMNQRLSTIHDGIANAASRVNIIANKIAGVAPQSDKAVGAPAIVPSSAREKVECLEHQLHQLSIAINRLD